MSDFTCGAAGFVGEKQGIITNSWTKSKWKKEEKLLGIGVESEKEYRKISGYFLAYSTVFTDSNVFSMPWFHPKNSRLLAIRLATPSPLRKS